jgi:hypothetical protein
MTVTVPHVDDMDDETFKKHMHLRHPFVGFVTRGEHEAAHRLNPTTLHRHVARLVQKSAEQL